jgi:hypothetical protein
MVADHTGSDRDGDGKDSVIIWNELFSNNTVQTAPFGIVFNSNNISPSNESADNSPGNPITHGAAGTVTQFVYADGCSLTIDPTRNASTRGAVWTTSSHTNTNVMVAYGTFGAGKFVAIGDSSPVDDGTGGLSGNIQLNLVLSAPPPPGEGTIASWNFDTPPYPNPLPASVGTGSIDFTSWTGVVTSFGGVTGQALALQGSAGNGSYIEFDFSMTGYAGLTISFQTRGTANGYNSGLWSWSVNGGGFTTLAGVNTATRSTSFSPVTVDFTNQTAIDNAASVRLRYTLSGATDSMQNNRIDDFVISATQVPTVSVVVNNSDAYEQGSQPASITVSSSLSAGAGGLPVHYQTSGSAIPPGSPGADYALGGNSGTGIVTIPAGATSATLVLTPAVDNDPTEFDETATVTLQPGAGYFVGTPTAGSITIHDDTPYTAAWAGRFPGFNGAAAAEQNDIEGDAISNFLEFAFDGDPFHSDTNILPVAGKMDFPDPDDGNTLKPYPIITFGRRTDAPNLTYSVESSHDLVNWANDVEQVSATPGPAPNMEQVVYRGLSPLSGNGAITPVFLRVRVSGDD